MTVAGLRRRFRRRFGGHDWFEGTSVVTGMVFLAGALVCVWAVGVCIATLGDAEPGFGTSHGPLEATRGLGIVLLSLLAVALVGVGWFLAGDAIRRVFDGRRRR
jgi:hypothetical protein